MTWVYFDGGSRSGQLDQLDDLTDIPHVVYTGPKWFGVYKRSNPLQIRPTDCGPAEVWRSQS